MSEAFAASKHFIPPADIYETAKNAAEIVSLGNQTGEGWFLTGEMLELLHTDTPNIVCTQPFGCLPNHVVGKGVIKELRKRHPEANIVAIDYDPGASEVNQLNRIKLMLSTALKNLNTAVETYEPLETPNTLEAKEIENTIPQNTNNNSSDNTIQGASINQNKHSHKKRSKGRRKDNTKNKSA